MSANLHAVRWKLTFGAGAGLNAAGNILLSAARARCPVESGALRASGGAQVEENTARISFSAPYAAIVHEKYSKFLEAPANDPGVQAEMLAALARQIQF